MIAINRREPRPNELFAVTAVVRLKEPIMPEAHTPLIERIARVLAGFALSSNGDGADASAGGDVDAAWRDYRGPALAVIRELREPDPAMTAAGDAEIWSSMVRAALERADADRP